jgi:hypothetical protein
LLRCVRFIASHNKLKYRLNHLDEVIHMTVNSTSFSEDRVRAIAHKLWLDEGMPEGRAEAHWLQALEIANAEQLAALKKVAAPRKAKAAAPAEKKKPAAAAAKKAAPRKRG